MTKMQETTATTWPSLIIIIIVLIIISVISVITIVIMIALNLNHSCTLAAFEWSGFSNKFQRWR